MDEGSDHLQLVKFWPSRAPGNGSAAVRNFLAPPYYSQRAVFASLSSFFIVLLKLFEQVDIAKIIMPPPHRADGLSDASD